VPGGFEMSRLITFVTKLTSFEFRWERGVDAGSQGVKELVFVTPCREYQNFVFDER